MLLWSFGCLVSVNVLSFFLTVLCVSLQLVIVVFPGRTHQLLEKKLHEFNDIHNLVLKTPTLEQILAKQICCELFTPSEGERGTSPSKSKCV